MKRYRTTADRLLAGCAVLTGAAYLLLFFSAFSSLPLHIPPPHQLLLLSFHALPLFCWQLLLCRTGKAGRRFALPLLAVLLPALLFVALCGFHIMAWYLAALWAAAPLLGIALGWAVWLACRCFDRRKR